MTSDFGRRIRTLTDTSPVTVEEVVERAGSPRRSRRAVVGAGSLAVTAAVVGLVIVTRPGGVSVQHVQVADGGGRSDCSLTAAVVPAAGVTVAADAASAPAVPVVRTAAVVQAPATSPRAAGGPEVTVGLNVGPDFGSEVNILRVLDGAGATYKVSLYSGDEAVGGMETPTFATMRAGDLVEVQLAVRLEDPNAGNYGKAIAVRVVDLRTKQTAQTGDVHLLGGSPAAPVHRAEASHEDVSVTETTWKDGWPLTTIGLVDEATHQSPPGYDTFVGVTQKRSDFLITDGAHPKTPVVLGTAGLHARAGDRVTVEASTPQFGAHTAVAITDGRTGVCVSSPG